MTGNELKFVQIKELLLKRLGLLMEKAANLDGKGSGLLVRSSQGNED